MQAASTHSSVQELQPYFKQVFAGVNTMCINIIIFRG